MQQNQQKTNITDLLCVTCGNRGFKRITKRHNRIKINVLECTSCKAELLEHETMKTIQAEK